MVVLAWVSTVRSHSARVRVCNPQTKDSGDATWIRPVPQSYSLHQTVLHSGARGGLHVTSRHVTSVLSSALGMRLAHTRSCIYRIHQTDGQQRPVEGPVFAIWRWRWLAGWLVGAELAWFHMQRRWSCLCLVSVAGVLPGGVVLACWRERFDAEEEVCFDAEEEVCFDAEEQVCFDAEEETCFDAEETCLGAERA
ncbi:hypothetical protein PMIN01_06108 [Paraphaeosphaeria minitans]|uniref:Uncharacterized protein n=1 Tax=Paraphaeosphaeria minitans TaxID=565426 RepID=A0A9P6KQW2_9PLEO|nr:hypothetical protein PMIN01_06108 [Paraphaeosphaeria minitans]